MIISKGHGGVEMKITNVLPFRVKVRNSEGIEFSNGVRMFDEHIQECCESVYADWSSLDDTGFDTQIFDELIIEKVDDVGFRINGYTVHCYNNQNGYYSSELSLFVLDNQIEILNIDITGCTENDYSY